MLDPRRLLTRSRLFDHDGNGRLDRPVRLAVDGVRYRLSGLQKQSDTYTLTFEDDGLRAVVTVDRADP